MCQPGQSTRGTGPRTKGRLRPRLAGSAPEVSGRGGVRGERKKSLVGPPHLFYRNKTPESTKGGVGSRTPLDCRTMGSESRTSKRVCGDPSTRISKVKLPCHPVPAENITIRTRPRLLTLQNLSGRDPEALSTPGGPSVCGGIGRVRSLGLDGGAVCRPDPSPRSSGPGRRFIGPGAWIGRWDPSGLDGVRSTPS